MKGLYIIRRMINYEKIINLCEKAHIDVQKSKSANGKNRRSYEYFIDACQKKKQQVVKEYCTEVSKYGNPQRMKNYQSNMTEEIANYADGMLKKLMIIDSLIKFIEKSKKSNEKQNICTMMQIKTIKKELPSQSTFLPSLGQVDYSYSANGDQKETETETETDNHKLLEKNKKHSSMSNRSTDSTDDIYDGGRFSRKQKYKKSV